MPAAVELVDDYYQDYGMEKEENDFDYGEENKEYYNEVETIRSKTTAIS